MTSTMITQPATGRAPLGTRPAALVVFGKVLGLVIALGTAVALVIAGGVGLAALVLSRAAG